MISLDGDWEFQHDPAGDLSPATLGPTRTIQVPLPWQAQFEDLRLVSGVGWYRRQFPVPDDWRGGVVLLHFGAVDYYAEVWINGIRVGDHEGGYLPFDLEIQKAVAFDHPNEIVVRVVDPGPDTAEKFPDFHFGDIPHGKQNWYGPIGGIWQSVYLEHYQAGYISRLRITPIGLTGEVDLSIYARNLSHATVARCQVVTTTGERVATVETSSSLESNTNWNTRVTAANPELWHPDNPVLYRVEVELVDGNKVVDRRADTFGFRTIEARNGQIWLNGRPIYLRGALDQDYYPGTIYTPPSDEFIRDRFLKAKVLGLNCLRCHIKAPDPHYYEWADRLGILIWTDLPSWGARPGLGGGYGPRTAAATDRALATLRGMVERDWNHPSLVCWSIVNEDWGTKLPTSAEDRRWVAEAYDALKALDPGRLAVDNSPCAPNFHVKSDLDDYHFYRAIPDHAREWSATIADFAGRPAWSYSQHGDAVRNGREPLVVSEFGNWGLPDVNKLVAAGGGEPWWFDTGANWGAARVRGLVHPRGILERYAALGLPDVFDSYEAFVRASQDQEYQALKFEIEEMRRHDSIQGYVITELTDVHWECNGLIDLWNQPKSFQQTLASINADDVIVPVFDPVHRRAYWAGEAITVDLTASLFSRRDATNTSVRWQLEPRFPPMPDDPRKGKLSSGTDQDSAGRVTAEGLQHDHVAHIGRLDLVAPASAAPASALLTLSMDDPTGSPIARNETEIFIVPRALRRAATPRTLAVIGQSGIVANVGEDSRLEGGITATLTDLGYTLTSNIRAADVVVGIGVSQELLDAVRDGARALVIVENAASVNANLAPLEIVDRSGSGYEGDWASSFGWLYQNRFQHRLPSGPRLDWAFESIVPDAVILGLTAEQIAQNALSAMFLGWIQKPAALAVQVGLGQGSLVVTTFRIFRPRDRAFGEDPVATVLFHDFVEHLMTPGFTPSVQLEPMTVD